ncbi:hypothetical protein [Aestuariimicrobium kwangyangense]|uniref:hypothetical protein n=1 Tax=Aestuariimicrobium kwangyangense TaxID=396389 RepID=UPI00146A266B|nr:hypothetical protein [Aestuariimicrobium kwangyangense]
MGYLDDEFLIGKLELRMQQPTSGHPSGDGFHGMLLDFTHWLKDVPEVYVVDHSLHRGHVASLLCPPLFEVVAAIP